MYTNDGKEYVRKTGSRQEVWDEICFCTSGKLKKEDLIMKNGRIVSKRRSELGKRRFQAKNPFQKNVEPVKKRDVEQHLPEQKRKSRRLYR